LTLVVNKYFAPTLDKLKIWHRQILSRIDLSTDTAAILKAIVSNSDYRMLRGKISMYLPPEHPTIEFKMAAVSVKRSILEGPYKFCEFSASGP